MAFYCFSMSNHAETFPAVRVAVHHNTTVCLEMNKCKKNKETQKICSTKICIKVKKEQHVRGDLEPHSLFGVGACVPTERCEV